MNREQLYKILKTALIATVLMFVFELIFSIDAIILPIQSWVTNITNKFWLYSAIWFIMWAQTCIIPIPAYIILNAAIVTRILDPTRGVFGIFTTSECWLFILIVISAYITGALCAYAIGRKWGKKAVLWCAGNEEDYNKWATILNSKGKWFYALTILLPVFPDDLLCLVAGAVKFNIKFFTIANLICRTIGLIFMIGALVIMQSANSGGIPWTVIGWGIAVLIEIIALIIMKRQIKRTNDTV